MGHTSFHDDIHVHRRSVIDIKLNLNRAVKEQEKRLEELKAQYFHNTREIVYYWYILFRKVRNEQSTLCRRCWTLLAN